MNAFSQMKLNNLDISHGINHTNTGFIHTEIKSRDGRVRGFGTDLNEHTSFIKAAHEFAERYSFHKLVMSRPDPAIGTSNGFACHFNFVRACFSARNEVLERDALLTQWVEEIAPLWIKKNDLVKILDSSSYDKISQLEKFGFLINLGVLSKVESAYVLIGCIQLKNNETGNAVATACDESVTSGFFRILSDLSRVADLLYSRKKNNQPLFKKIVAENVIEPMDHLEFYLDPDSWIGLEWFFKSTEDVRSYNMPAFSFDKLSPCPEIPWEHAIARAQCASLQSLYFGKTRNDLLNKQRILTIKNLRLHPLA